MIEIVTIFRSAAEDFSVLEWQSTLDARLGNVQRQGGWSNLEGGSYRAAKISDGLRKHLEAGFDLKLSIACMFAVEDGSEQGLDAVLRICDAAGDQWVAIDDRNVVLAAQRSDNIIISDFGDDMATSSWLGKALAFFVEKSPKPVQQSALKEMLQ